MGKNNGNLSKNVHSGHRQRVRKRFLQTGFYGFNEHQILEMLLFYCVPRKDTNVLAHNLIERFGNLSAVLNAKTDELKDFGLSENASVLFHMVPAATELYYNVSSSGMIFNSQEKLSELFLSQFSEDRFEIRAACFRNDMSLITTKLLYAGERFTADVSKMSYKEYSNYIESPEFEGFPVECFNFRDIVETIVSCGSSMAAVAHNHLYNNPFPCDEEIAAIKELKKLLNMLEITLVDYIIVGDGIYMPMRGNDIYGIYQYGNEPSKQRYLELP